MFDPLNSSRGTVNPPQMRCTDVPQFTALQMAASHFKKDPKLHLKHLLADAFRCQGLMAVHKTSPAFENGSLATTTNMPQIINGDNTTLPLLLRRDNSGPFSTNSSGGGGASGDTAVPRWSNNSDKRQIILDYSRQHVDGETMELLFDLADQMGLTERMNEMRAGMDINFTERRAVMHHVLRMPRGYDYKARHPQGDTILNDVHSVLDRIAMFSDDVRGGNILGCTGKKLKSIVCIGIGGSHAGPEAVYEALRGDSVASKAIGQGCTIRFVANVDPVDFDLNCRDLIPEETLIIVTSKSFTTAETMQNARTARRWLVSKISSSDITEADIVAHHFCAISSSTVETEKFGIKKEHIFPIFDWVLGRFSVWSAAGMLPLSLHYSFDVAKRILDGAHDIDEHFFDAPLGGNIPVLLGLLGVWNSTFMGYHTRALLPYSHALRRLPSLVMKFDMESNGKRVTAAGIPLPFDAGEIDFGEAGSNGQHTFYQLLVSIDPFAFSLIFYNSLHSLFLSNSIKDGLCQQILLDSWKANLESMRRIMMNSRNRRLLMVGMQI